MEPVEAAHRISPTLPPEAPVAEWRVIRPIGRGNAATVYEAEHTRTSRRVALEVVDVDIRRYPSLRARFEREVRVMAGIEDARVPRVIDFGELDSGSPYVVMERLEGETLQQRIDRESMTVREVLWLARELLLAVAAVHQHDVVHRDVKPANVFLHRGDGGRETVKLLDFGICFPRRDIGLAEHLTDRGGLLGTAGYIAPELLRGAEPDARADLYAVGAVLYECLTGVPPHAGETWSQVVQAISEHPVRVRSLRRDCPVGLDRFVSLALAADPERRFRTANEMLACLDEVRRGGVPVRPNECLYCVRTTREPERPPRPPLPWRILTVASVTAASVATGLGLLFF